MSGSGNQPGDPAVKSEWSEKFPNSVCLKHDEPAVRDVLKFFDNMMGIPYNFGKSASHMLRTALKRSRFRQKMV